MVRRGRPQPNHFIYPYVLKSLPEVFQSRVGTELVHAQIVKSGFGQYPAVQTSLLDSYSRFSSDIGTARQLFDEMSSRNVVSWTAMISAYCRLGEIGNALLLFEKIPERDTTSWNAIMSGCTQNGVFSEAISLFNRMISYPEQCKRVQSNKPNQVTLACALSSCGHRGMLLLGRCIHAYAYRNGLGSDSFISNALVDMYGKCGNLKEATKAFSKTSSRSLTAWNSMLNSFALNGKCESAICLFEEMVKHEGQIEPDEITFVGLLNACTHGGLVDKGRFYFRLMTERYGIQPEIQHYGCLIDLLGRSGQFEEAMQIVKGMRIEPDEVVWSSLLNGCKIHGRTDWAELVVKKLIEIDPNIAGYGIMLANVYGELGKWDESWKVRRVLMERNAYKTLGCSWIEIDHHVHQFSSTDKVHPRTNEIYAALEGLAGQYKV